MSGPEETNGTEGAWFETDVAVRVSKWLVFGVVLSLVPLLLDLVVMQASAQQTDPQNVIKNGQLALVCAGLSGAAIGELICSGKSFLAIKYFCGGISAATILVAAGFYAAVAHKSTTDLNPSNSAGVSWIILLVTLLSGTGTVMVGGKADEHVTT